MPDLAGGYGCPTFVFYQPLFFYVSSVFAWLPKGSAIAPLCAVAVFLILGGAGAYKVGRHFGNERFGVFIATLFLLTPYVFVNFYVRGDLSELAAMMITPWPVHYLFSLIDRLKNKQPITFQAAGLAISLAAIVHAHPAVALLYWPTFFAIAGIGFVGRPVSSVQFVKVMSVVMVCSLALCCPYWFPVLNLKGAVCLDRATTDYYQAATHTVYPLQWLKPSWHFGGSVPDSIRDRMSFQLGLPHFLLAVVGLWMARDNKQLLYLGLVYVALLIFMTSLSRTFWENIGLARLVQFPWRLLSCVAIVQILCIGGLSKRLDSWRIPVFQGFLPVCLVVASAGWYSRVFQVRDDSYELSTVERTVETQFQRYERSTKLTRRWMSSCQGPRT